MKAWGLRFQACLAELSPEQIALLLSVGLVLGVFPIMGCPTVLCLLAAFGLRLNLAALQLLNNISSPLQLALLLPLARAGTRLCGDATPAGGSWTGTIGSAALHAITGWACICIPLGAVLYVSLVFLLRPSWSSGGRRQTIAIADIATGRIERRIAPGEGRGLSALWPLRPNAIAWRNPPDGTMLVPLFPTYSWFNPIGVLDLARGRIRRRRIDGHLSNEGGTAKCL